VLVAVERNGPVRATPVASDKIAELFPQLDRFVDKAAHLMTDENHSYRSIGRGYAAHDWVNHSQKEYVRGDIHNNTAESFSALLERAKQGVFHFLSSQHLGRYLHEIGFRWDHRIPQLKLTKKGDLKIVMCGRCPLLQCFDHFYSGLKADSCEDRPLVALYALRFNSYFETFLLVIVPIFFH